jgi:hydrogenase maturation protease
VRLEEGGCDGLLLGTLWAGEPELWLVDALLGGKPPGTVSRLSHQELLALPQRHGSGHQLSLSECLRCLVLAEPSFEEVRLTLFGIEPLACDFPAPLSPLVAAAAEALAAALRAELEAPG